MSFYGENKAVHIIPFVTEYPSRVVKSHRRHCKSTARYSALQQGRAEKNTSWIEQSFQVRKYDPLSRKRARQTMEDVVQPDGIKWGNVHLNRCKDVRLINF